ncbi:MAG: thymidine phosphorylase [Nitrospirae bacterium]|nr:thymidine phosphorylase [Nitrospirota bacterium]
MRPYDIIKKKRDGYSLTKDELSAFLTAYLKNEIPDYQISAFLMAVFFKGMTKEETVSLTEVMLDAGSRIDLSDIQGHKIDKHSTGGVGDKVSLILVPLMASAGIIVPMMSGRGLGHTGGTVDKLESIPGFRTALSVSEFKEALSRIRCAMIGYSEEMSPLDKKLYALRDVTATIDSVPLITGSIMSKKLSEGIEGLVLDVKVGKGAFMKDMESARTLARSMVDIGNAFGVKTIAVITAMNEPLGMAVGNSLEVTEAIDCLKGNGPDDLMEVTLYIGALMLRVAGIEADIEEGKKRLAQLIEDGSALRKFRELIELQGGNPQIVERPSLLPYACLTIDVLSEESGYIQSMDAEAIGIVSMILGAGRERIDSEIDPAAGIILKKKTGDFVEKDELLCSLCTSDEEVAEKTRVAFLDAVKFGDSPPEKKLMIIEVIE